MPTLASRPVPSRWLTDSALALVLAAAAVAELWSGSAESDALALSVAVVGTAVLALRRALPLVTCVATYAPLWLLTVRGEDTIPFGHLVAMLVASYTVARSEPLTRAVPALAFAVATSVASSMNVPDPAVGDVVFPVILVAGPWLAGRSLRLWAERADELGRLNAELEVRREEAATLAVAAERGLIARELHDSLAQSLQVIVVNAEAADAALDRDTRLTRDALDRIRCEGREALAQTRRTLGVLRSPGGTATAPGLASLDRLVASVRSAGVDVEVHTSGQARSLPAEIDAAAFRIVQEGLTNVLKHAGAGLARVDVTYRDDRIDVEVTDDGHGVVAASPSSGHGLVGMRERTQLLGGRLVTGPSDRGGFRVRAELPLPGGSS